MERETRVVGPLSVPHPRHPVLPSVGTAEGAGEREKGPGSTPLTRCRARVLSPAALSVPAVEARVGWGTGVRVSMVVVETGS